MTKPSLLVASALSLLLAGCLDNKPSAGFQTALPPPPVPAFSAPSNGSIFQVSAGYAPLHIGNRARAVGDPLTIMLVESVRTSKSASSSTAREGGFSLSPPATGPFSFLSPDALSASGQSAFDGQGNAAQTSSLSGTLSVTIAEVYPNGTALVRGQKLLELSQGQEWVQFSGLVRLTDIDGDNRITSNRVADARIVYSGRGAVQIAGREGWLSRFFNLLTPF
ncbi:MAG: flagellar biosynthesis protein FlgH [Sphingomonadales bacterium 32-68-7]|nr:MAG: flagellar biosynthesis protein FlgH [Sphingomonadales bacterium 12-68-11]OYX10148.1 MAG: flagellar biosynthesis protein FlgH [Sphingomonadales bacterium 32-68-7]